MSGNPSTFGIDPFKGGEKSKKQKPTALGVLKTKNPFC